MSHELKFGVGDKVKVVGAKYSGEWLVGTFHTIAKVEKESRQGTPHRNYQEYKLDTGWWVTEEDIELVPEEEC